MGKANKKGLAKKLAFKAEMKSKRKELKKRKTAKRAKLMLRNLPFETNEDNLREHFKQYGDIREVNILKKPDGKLVGCGFVQFKLVQKAAKARHHLNGKPFLGRNIEIDFAMAKDKYKKKVKKEKLDAETVEIKDEPVEEIDTSIVKIEDEIKTESENVEVSSETVENNSDKESEEESEDDGDEDKDDMDDDDEMDDDEDDTVNNLQDDNEPKRPHVISNDVSEGKTVFIKNVPFSATNEDLKQCLLQFGPLYYALICVDRLTEHSKGTAFVKFTNQEDAEKCLQAGTELKLLGNILDCHQALNKNDLQQKRVNRDSARHKDSRNLYLIKEGVILAGTKAAENVSASDMAKRLQLEQYKTQMLRKLNMYISRNRLIIHNLPQSWDDSKLRALFQKFAGPKAVIKEAKIMRNMRNVDSQGIGESKQHAFVTFIKHEDALKALRSLNNNPTIFSAAKRPIVAFSIENRVMVKAKEKRLQRSRLKNPTYKGYDANLDKKEEKQDKKGVDSGSGENQKYTGVTAKPGVSKMRSRFNLRTQAKLHYENLKKEKKKKKSAKKTLHEKRQEFTKQPKQKINRSVRQEADNFSKLINSYKEKLINMPLAKKSKWYDLKN